MTDVKEVSPPSAREVATALAEIRAVIDLATEGEWRYVHPGCVKSGPGLVASAMWPNQEPHDWPQRERDARYIVATRPTNVRRLLDALATLEAATETRVSTDLMEQLADAEHASWARWMDYLFRMCHSYDDGSYLIPALLADRWKRQAVTPYAELSEQEKESDRDEVRHILPLIDAATKAARREGIEWALGAVAQRIWNDWQGDSRAQIAYRTIEEVRARAQGAQSEAGRGGGE